VPDWTSDERLAAVLARSEPPAYDVWQALALRAPDEVDTAVAARVRAVAARALATGSHAERGAALGIVDVLGNSVQDRELLLAALVDASPTIRLTAVCQIAEHHEDAGEILQARLAIDASVKVRGTIRLMLIGLGGAASIDRAIASRRYTTAAALPGLLSVASDFGALENVPTLLGLLDRYTAGIEAEESERAINLILRAVGHIIGREEDRGHLLDEETSRDILRRLETAGSRERVIGFSYAAGFGRVHAAAGVLATTSQSSDPQVAHAGRWALQRLSRSE
jgi:hypothetical protein